MSGLMMAVFIKESLLPNIKDIRSVSIRTGLVLSIIVFVYIYCAFRN